MADDRKITNGPNERASAETIAGTGPGIPDEALHNYGKHIAKLDQGHHGVGDAMRAAGHSGYDCQRSDSWSGRAVEIRG